MKKVLVVHTWGIGDWLYFTPVIQALRQRFKALKIDVILGTPHARQIVGLYKNVSIKGVFNVRKELWGLALVLLKLASERYDTLIFSAGLDSSKADLLASLIRAKNKIALLTNDKKPRFLNLFMQFDKGQHMVINNLKILDLIGVKYTYSSPFIPLDDIPSPFPRSVLIHPGCELRHAYKRWPTERFAFVAEQLLDKGTKVSVVLGPSERELEKYFTYLKGRDNFKLYSELAFLELISVIACHETILNNDSSLGHIAAAIGRHVITIFGPSDPVKNLPFTANSSIIRIAKALPCMPCMHREGKFGCLEHFCLKGISTDEVVKQVAFLTSGDRT